jgi:hypothetical protein
MRVKCLSQSPRGLGHELSSFARTLGSWVRIPLREWISVCAFILCLYCPVCNQLPCDGLITRPRSPTVCVVFFFKFRVVGWDWVHLVCRPLIGLLYQHRMIDDNECAVVGGMRIGRGKRSTRRKPAAVPLCPPQIPHDLTWTRTRAAPVGSRRLTARAMARLTVCVRKVTKQKKTPGPNEGL